MKTLCCLVRVAATCCSMGVNADPIAHTDLVYANTSSRNVLDIYVPEDQSNPPLVLYVHGGGWLHNSKQDVHSQRVGLDRLIEAGFAVAAMNYRLAPSPDYPEADPAARAIWPAQLEDVGTAFDFPKANGQVYGYDPDRIALFGESAGGHIVLATGLSFAETPDRHVEAVVAWYPATDLAHIDADREKAGIPVANLGAAAPESYLIGANVDVETEMAADASPLHMLDKVGANTKLPPFLLMHGRMDRILPYNQSVKFAEKIDALGREAELVLVTKGAHAAGAFNTDPKVLDSVIGFLGTQLRLNPQQP